MRAEVDGSTGIALDTGFSERWLPGSASRQISLLAVLGAHLVVIGSILTLKHTEVVRPVLPSIEVLLASEQADPTQAPPLPPAMLDRPPVNIPPPEVEISLSVPDAVVSSDSTPNLPAATPRSSQPPADSVEPVADPQFDAAYLRNPAPLYPAASRRQHEQGTVVLRARVSEEGTALEVLIQHTSGWRALDEAAVKAVRLWRFVPAKQGGKSVSAWVLIPVEFSLHH